jgi:hypothetical protein
LNNALTANRQAVGGFLRFEEKHNAVYLEVFSWLHFQTKAVDGSQSPTAFVGFANILQT